MRRLAGRRAYLDANVFIYFLERYPPMSGIVNRLFSMVANREIEAVTGEIAVAEFMVGPYRAGTPDVIERARAFFRASGAVTIVGHGEPDFDLAAKIRADRGLPLIDALHVATALNAGCTILVTNDQRMPSVPGLEVVRLKELEQLDG